MSTPTNETRVIVALDCGGAVEALGIADRLAPELCRLKVGKELFTAAGPTLVDALHERGFEVFLDLKFHDIPNTVAQACRSAAGLGVWMVDVHALGGGAMMRAAREALEGARRRPLLIAVTVLTSLSRSDLREIGLDEEPEAAAMRLAGLARDAGLDGVVCSAREAPALRAATGPGFRLVTPGIRPASSASDDQVRVTTPAEAVRNGADYLVIGRPVTRAADPRRTLEGINAEIAAALKG